MRFFVYSFIFIILLVATVSLLLPSKDKRKFSDDGLRAAALSRNMSSTGYINSEDPISTG